MNKKTKNCLKRFAAATLILFTVSGVVPFQPIIQDFNIAVTASAAVVDSGSINSNIRLPRKLI